MPEREAGSLGVQQRTARASPSFEEVLPVDWTGIIDAIKGLGFPIACVVAMFLMWQKEVESHKQEMTEMRTSMEEQTKATTEALNNNTMILQKILTKLGEE